MDKSKKEKKEDIQMNSDKYKELKEVVISLNQDELINLFEIVIDEMNARKLEKKASEIRNKQVDEPRKV